MTTPLFSKTKAQLEELGWPYIGIQLKDGSKHFGRVTQFSPHKIYFRDRHGDELDVPRRIISRALLAIDGGKKDGGSTAICKAHQPAGRR